VGATATSSRDSSGGSREDGNVDSVADSKSKVDSDIDSDVGSDSVVAASSGSLDAFLAQYQALGTPATPAAVAAVLGAPTVNNPDVEEEQRAALGRALSHLGVDVGGLVLHRLVARPGASAVAAAAATLPLVELGALVTGAMARRSARSGGDGISSGGAGLHGPWPAIPASELDQAEWGRWDAAWGKCPETDANVVGEGVGDDDDDD
jgi:hypothetical protein